MLHAGSSNNVMFFNNTEAHCEYNSTKRVRNSDICEVSLSWTIVVPYNKRSCCGGIVV